MQSLVATLLRFSFLSFAMAEEMVKVEGHGNAWQYGTGGGIIAFIVLVLDIIVFRTSPPPLCCATSPPISPLDCLYSKYQILDTW